MRGSISAIELNDTSTAQRSINVFPGIQYHLKNNLISNIRDIISCSNNNVREKYSNQIILYCITGSKGDKGERGLKVRDSQQLFAQLHILI